MPTARLDLNGKYDTAGALTLEEGRSLSAQVTTGTGTLSLMGDITLNAFQGSSGASPAARISGNLDLGSSFNGITAYNGNAAGGAAVARAAA